MTREDRAIWGEGRFEAHSAFAHPTLEARPYCESAGEYAPELGNGPRDTEAAADAPRQGSAGAYAIIGGRGTPEQVESWTGLTKRAKADRDGYLELAQNELGSA